MKKNNWLHKKKSFLSLAVILVMSLVAFSYSGYLKANNETSGYQFHIIKNEDGYSADIIGDQTKLKEGVHINKIVNPDGEAMDLQHVSYYVNTNDSYSFKIEFTSETGEHVESVQIAVNSLSIPNVTTDKTILPLSEAGNKAINKSMSDGPSAIGKKTVLELKAEKTLENKAATPFLIPMFIEGENTSQGNYSFSGGDIENIAEQTFNGLPYKFQKAEISIKEGDENKTYTIDYYDTVDNKTYYSLAGKSDASQDFEVAYEVPAGAVVSFIFQLNTKSYPVTINNTKESEGFSIKYITGIKSNPDGTYSAQQNSLVKLVLTYPLGYYVENAPAGQRNVDIEFSDSSVVIIKDQDKSNRTISYTFTYPGNPMTLNVVGDKEETGLMYGVYDSTSNYQNGKEQGSNWWKATDVNGVYTEGQPYYGYSSGDSNYGAMIVRGGTSKQVKVEGQQNLVNIATGTYSSGQELNFEYAMNRVNQLGHPPYFFWPSPTMSLCYFSNGADVTKDTPIAETFPLWSSDWIYDPNVPDSSIITNTYNANNGARITITVKKSVYIEKTTSTAGVILNVPSYQVHVKIENMKNSFYIKTQGAGSVQGNHYFRNLNGVSLARNNNIADSYFLEDIKDEQGGNTGTIGKTSISSGGIFLDKRAVYNKNINVGANLNEGGVPWEAENKPFFKFSITPKWGYTNPRVVSYGKDITPIMTNKPIEIEKKERENNGQSVQDLTLGKYSWFNSSIGRNDVSSFHYTMFMPVESLGTIHDMRAVDVETDKITGIVTNNNEFVNTDAQQNTIVNGNGSFDLLENDKIVFNPNFKAPEKPDKVFSGFTATITAPDNTLLPTDYKLVLAKDVNNTVYFKPGDVISISDFFRRDASILLDSWNENNKLNATEKERLNLLMYSSKMNVKINLVYQDATSSEGQVITAYVNKYLQDIGKSDLVYSTAIADSKSIDVIKGTNIVFNKFAETFVNPIDHYTYYLNMDHTTALPSVTTDAQEIASVKYDRGLTVSYLNSDGTPFTGIVDNTVYKTYAGSNKALIKFPTVAQSPIGKTFDYWTAEKLDETGNWIPIPDLKITNTEDPAVYNFSSGPDGNNKSIRLKVAWKDISPDSYITIPKNIQLYEKDTNLTPQNDYAGQKVTISYHNVHGSDRTVNVDVLKSFDLSLIDNPSKKIEVSTYRINGDLLDTPGINSSYARIGVFGNTSSTSKDIWFNTASQNGNEVYKGEFGISSVPAEITNNTLFYISNKTQ